MRCAKYAPVMSAKDIRVYPISSKDARQIIKKYHYSGKVVLNSKLHFGVFLRDHCLGALQFGPSMDKRHVINLVAGTKWNEFLELNRLAFSDILPRNSESRALAYCFKFIKKNYPWIKWIISFADGTQCGDGTIYRASGFVLTKINKNTTIYLSPDKKKKITDIYVKTQTTKSLMTLIKGKHILRNGAASMKQFKEQGWTLAPGYQLRYIYFLDKESRKNLTVPIIPFNKINEIGAGMYKGKAREASRRCATQPSVERAVQS